MELAIFDAYHSITIFMKIINHSLLPLLLLAFPFFQTVSGQTQTAEVQFTGGYETNSEDNGRPVILIASALGVPPDVFRDAFSKVKPAPAGVKPDPEQVKRNKETLLTVLGPYGITNDTLDKVSDYYRYSDAKGEVWKRRPAKAVAIIADDKITGFKITDGGNGYTSTPQVSVPGYNIKVNATVSFSKDFEKNGSVTELKVVEQK